MSPKLDPEILALAQQLSEAGVTVKKPTSPATGGRGAATVPDWLPSRLGPFPSERARQAYERAVHSARGQGCRDA